MSRYHGPGRYVLSGFSFAATPRQRVRELKRLEAEERNEATPPERRRAYRRQLEQAAVAAPARRAAKRKGRA